MGEGFLHVDVLTELHGLVGSGGVGVVGGGHRAGVDFRHLLEHFAVVFELLGIFQLVEGFARAVPVGVAECDDVFAVAVAGHDVAHALTAGADGGNVEFFVGRNLAGNDLGIVGGGDGRGSYRGSGSREKGAARQ